VVLQALAHRKLVHGRQTHHLQVGGRTNAAEQEDLRALVAAGAEDDLALGPDLHDLPVPVDLNASGGGPVEQKAVDVGPRDQVQVWPLQNRMQVGHRRRAAHSVALGHLIPADAVLLGPVEVLVAGEPGLLAGLDEGLAGAVARPVVDHAQRAAHAV
jgi:hypothetical protein